MIKLKLAGESNIIYSVQGEDDNFKGNITVYDKEPKEFECKFVGYLLATPIQWILTYDNGTEAVVHISEKSMKFTRFNSENMHIFKLRRN